MEKQSERKCINPGKRKLWCGTRMISLEVVRIDSGLRNVNFHTSSNWAFRTSDFRGQLPGLSSENHQKVTRLGRVADRGGCSQRSRGLDVVCLEIVLSVGKWLAVPLIWERV